MNPFTLRVIPGQNAVSLFCGIARTSDTPHVCGPLAAGNLMLLNGTSIRTT